MLFDVTYDCPFSNRLHIPTHHEVLLCATKAKNDIPQSFFSCSLSLRRYQRFSRYRNTWKIRCKLLVENFHAIKLKSSI